MNIIFVAHPHNSNPAPCSALINLIFRYFPTALRGEHEILRVMHRWLHLRLTKFDARPRFIPHSPHDMRTAMESFRAKLRKPYRDEDPINVEDASMLANFLAMGLSPKEVDLVGPLMRAIFVRCWVEIDGFKAEPGRHAEIMRLCGSGLS